MTKRLESSRDDKLMTALKNPHVLSDLRSMLDELNQVDDIEKDDNVRAAIQMMEYIIAPPYRNVVGIYDPETSMNPYHLYLRLIIPPDRPTIVGTVAVVDYTGTIITNGHVMNFTKISKEVNDDVIVTVIEPYSCPNTNVCNNPVDHNGIVVMDPEGQIMFGEDRSTAVPKIIKSLLSNP